MKFITYSVELTDEALNLTWTCKHTYHYSSKDWELDRMTLPKLEEKFGKEVMWGFGREVGFFGRTISVSPVKTTYEDRQPTIDEAKKIRGYEMLRLVPKDEQSEPVAPTPFYKVTKIAQGELE